MQFSTFRTAVVGALVAATSVVALPQTTSPSPSSSKACNNSPTLCSRAYNTITHMGAHNAPFLRDSSTQNSLSGNQYKNATLALDGGLRLLQGQVHLQNGVLRLCHSSCSLLDAGPLKDWLSAISAWMEQNPNDVVTVLLVNANSAPAAQIATAFKDSGISKFAYTSTATAATGNWPTLQSMITKGTRLVSFVTNTKYDSSVPFLLPEFDFAFETAFEVTTIDGFNCTLDRPKSIGTSSAAVASNYLSLVNHFKYQSLIAGVLVPDVDSLSIVNDPDTTKTGSLGLHLKTCNTLWGARPNFVLVDFWDQANPIAAVDAINGVNDITGRVKPSASVSAKSGANGNNQNLAKGTLIAFCAALLCIV